MLLAVPGPSPGTSMRTSPASAGPRGARDGPEPSHPEIPGSPRRGTDRSPSSGATRKWTANTCCWPCSTRRRGWCRACCRSSTCPWTEFRGRLVQALDKLPVGERPRGRRGQDLRDAAAQQAAGAGREGSQAAQGRVRLGGAPGPGPDSRRASAPTPAGCLPAFGVTAERFLEALVGVRGHQRVTSATPEGTYEALQALRPRPRRGGPGRASSTR